MQFYSYSTKEKRDEASLSTTTASTKISINRDQLLSSAIFSPNLFYFNQCCRELIEVTTMVNLQFVKNNQLIELRAKMQQ